MIFKTDRPNLQVYAKGEFEAIKFVGKTYKTDDAKEIKILRSIDGVSEQPEFEEVDEPEEKPGFFSKKKREEIQRNNDAVMNEKVGENE